MQKMNMKINVDKKTAKHISKMKPTEQQQLFKNIHDFTVAQLDDNRTSITMDNSDWRIVALALNAYGVNNSEGKNINNVWNMEKDITEAAKNTTGMKGMEM